MTGKRITSYDVAKKADVSRTTVSFVVNNVSGVNISDVTRQRVLDAIEELNYHPDSAARRLASGKSYTLGLVLLQTREQVYADAVLPQVLLGFSHIASKYNYHVLLNPLDPVENTGYSHLIHEKHVDGIVLSGPRLDDEELVSLSEIGLPVILMGQMPGTSIPFVDIDAIQGAKTIVEHLISLGRREIALITNGPMVYTSAQQRCQGFTQALNNASIPIKSEFVHEACFTPESGYEKMVELLQCKPKPNAVFVASDVVALGAIRAIKQAGLRIPEDIAVAGFDDISLARYFDPSLTTIHLPAFELGYAVGERLVRLMQGVKLSSSGLLLETELIIRESTVGNGSLK